MGKKKLFCWSLLLITLSLSLGGSLLAQGETGVDAVVVNDFANVRIVPAIGAEVITTVPAGYLFQDVNGRSADNEWVRVNFGGSEGWVHTATLTVVAGSMYTLPIADPRSIPYGGWEAPRSGLTSATSERTATLLNGLHVRAGPSTGYPILAEAFYGNVVPLLGRVASNAWVQVNHQGTLGWIASRYLQLSPGTVISDLPLDGIIAEAPVIGDPTGEDYIATLKFMLERVNLAQPSLDIIRAYWTDAALMERAICREYPPQPTPYNVPRALLASHYIQLNPLSILFNDAMANVTTAIDAFINVCEQPGIYNPVGRAQSIEALDVVALADTQFAELRRRLNELLPAPVDIGAGECIFSFAGQTTVLPVLPIGQVITDNMAPDKYVTGYCFDAFQDQPLVFETLQLGASNIVHLLAVSPVDNPTNFTITGQGYDDTPALVIGPIFMPQGGRHVLILQHTGADPPSGEFGVLIHEPFEGVFGGVLHEDPITGQPIISLTPVATPIPGSVATCPNIVATCAELTDCTTALACLTAGNFSLDPDADGIPCEGTLCPASP